MGEERWWVVGGGGWWEVRGERWELAMLRTFLSTVSTF